MKIRIGKYLIEPELTANSKWNVYHEVPTQKHRFTKKGNEGKLILKSLAYGCTLESALTVVVGNKMQEIDKEGTLEEYFKEYRDVLNKMLGEIEKL